MGRTTACAITTLLAAFAAVLLLASVGLVFNAGSAFAMYTQAEVGSFKSATHYVVLDKSTHNEEANPNEWAIFDMAYADKMTKAKSSNPKVVKVANPTKNSFNLLMKKPGKATVTYKYKGKKYAHKFVVLKPVNPAKVVKLGSKNYAAKLKKVTRLELSGSFAGKKLVLKPIAGWKVKDVVVTASNSEKHKKSGYKIRKTDSYISVVWESKKNHALVATAIFLKDQG